MNIAKIDGCSESSIEDAQNNNDDDDSDNSDKRKTRTWGVKQTSARGNPASDSNMESAVVQNDAFK